MVQLSDHSILCTSYGWAWLRPEAAKTMTNLASVGNFAFLGGYILRSADGGHHWDEPIIPPAIPQANCAGPVRKSRCGIQPRSDVRRPEWKPLLGSRK